MQPLYLHRNLQIMFGVILMIVLGVSSIMPVLPVIMREMSVPALSIGLVLTAFTLPGVVLAPLAGLLADRWGRKRILVASLLTFGVFGTACAAAKDFDTLLCLRFLQGIGVAPLGVLHPTIIGDLYDGRDRITAMGYSAMALSMGTAVFPVIGGALAMYGWRYPFLLPVVALPLALVVSLFLNNPEPKGSQRMKDYIGGTLAVIQTKQAVGLFVLTFFTAMIMYGPFVTYLPVLLEERFLASPATTGVIVASASVFTALASSQVGRLSGTGRSEFSLLAIAFVLYFISMMMIPLLSNLWSLVLPVILIGAGMGLNAPTRVALIAGLAPMANRAAILSVNAIALRLGQTIAPVLAGLLVAGMGLDAVYLAGASLALVMLALAGWMTE